LVAREARLKTLKDFTPNDKIGVVAPDSLQAINLRKAAQTELGDAHALDKNLISIAPADAEQALLSGQIAANFASSPFQFREVAQGGHIVIHSYDTFGKVTSDEIVTPQSFYDQYPTFAKKLYADLVAATAFITSNRHQTAEYLSNDQVGKASSQQFETWLADPSFEFDTHPVGLASYATFMKSIGMISKVPASDKDLLLPTVQ
jgi:NitT/TauT family transport system substrate-binding protein